MLAKHAKKPKREKVNREKKSKEYSGIKWSSKNFAIKRNLYNNCFIFCSRANNNISQETRKLANSIISQKVSTTTQCCINYNKQHNLKTSHNYISTSLLLNKFLHRFIVQFSFQLFGFVHFAHCFHEVFLSDVISGGSDCKHPRLRTHVSQISPIKAI